MENFVVSARKYRPATFNTVVGQVAITGTLKNAIRNNQLAQAFLFCGPRGIGKTTCARILAKTINCLHPTADTEPCNECTSCKAFNDSASFNIHELDAASNNSVDDIRTLVDQVRIPPQMGKYKVYIIDEVHMLSSQAFNAFLKTLEEPPSYAKFILATTEKHKIIPTILSRCQIFDFKRITIDDIAKHLLFVAESEGIVTDPEALHIIAIKADGALRDALSIFDQMVNLGDRMISRQLVLENLNVLDYDYFFRIMDCMRNGNFRDTLLIVNEIIGKGFDGQHFITGLGEHLRNLLMSIDPATVKLIETSDAIRSKYAEQAKSVSLQLLIDALDIMNKCDVTYRSSNNKRLSLEIPLIQICKLSGQMIMPVVTQMIQPASVSESKPEPLSQVANVPENAVTPSASNPTQTPLTTTTLPTSYASASQAVVSKGVATKDDLPPTSPSPATKPLPTHDVPVQSHHQSSISIKGLANADELANSVVNEPALNRRESFTFEQIEQALLKFAESIKEDSALYYSALTAYKPGLQANNLLIITVGNSVLEKEFNERRNTLLEFLRQEMKNDFITIRTVVSEQPLETKKYMSDQEKLNAMVQANPNVEKLRDQLSLELDV